MGLIQDLEKQILIADGAMGTLLYSYGIDHCFEELNVSNPQEIERIHREYIEAGAKIIQTNTYGANRIKLARYGLENEVQEINAKAVEIAKKTVKTSGKPVYVLGTIGGIRTFQKAIFSTNDILQSFEEQLDILLKEQVDGILLETYYDLDELKAVLEVARKKTDLPIMANVSLHEKGVLQSGTPLAEGFNQLIDLGANIVGLNCRLGPYHMIQSFEEIPIPNGAFLSAYPNGSLPRMEDGRLVYESDEQYFYEAAIQFVKEGVRLLGGCCGTRPEHIRAMAEAVKNLSPVTEKKVIKEKPIIQLTQIQQVHEPSLVDIVKSRRSVIVEFDPPKTLPMSQFLSGVSALKNAKIDAITLADNSLASPRISNVACAQIVKNRYHLRPIVHLTCRDRNLIGIQSHLMGLHALGIHDILALTGDPTKIGDFPGASSVFDLTSFDLIRLIKQFNEGLSYSGTSLGEKTNFTVAAAFNPHVKIIEKSVARLEKKIHSGADYFITQPVYSEELIINIYDATKHLDVPIYIGIMPLTSTRNAEFIHNEVPGIKLPDSVREQMKKVGNDKEQGKREGIAIAKHLIDVAFDLFHGIYLITPFLNYQMSVELINYIHEKEQMKVEREITSV